VRTVELETVVGRSLPFNRTTELLTKFEPITSKEKDCAPAGAQGGGIEVMVGTGLVPFVLVKFCTFEIPPPGTGLVTVTAKVPAEATALAGIVTNSCVESKREPPFRMVVTGLVPKLTVEPLAKFVPLIVSVNGALPTKELLGEISVIAGIGFDKEAEVPPVLELYWPAEPQPARRKAEMMLYNTMNRSRENSLRVRSRAGMRASP
jgi:hypothetical protein